ncbi:MAG TPA: SHOCT domain-containing protein [Allosphingosinicella sp.]|nr:SHOCT domain-containing protein [Allosphingosinicella sp.]
MTDHIEALERLQKLRESGAITEAEFELEKERLLRPVPPPPSAPLPPTLRPLPWPWIAGGAAAILLVALLAFLLLRRTDGEGGNAAQTANVVEPPVQSVNQVAATPTMRDRPQAEQLATAFRAVFGRASPLSRRIDGAPGSERAARILWTTFGPVLLTESRIPDGCHACAGYVGAYYLRDTGNGFEVVARYPEAVSGPGWGNPPEGWRIVENFTTHPAVYAEGGSTGQGYTQTYATITELRPQGPIESRVDLGSDNSGAVLDESQAFALEGRITNVVRNRSFDVVYSGSCNLTRRHVFRNGRFEPVTGGGQDSVACPGMEATQ